MDANKLVVLREIGYRILPTCAMCAHSSFPQNDWGTCAINVYQHAKHTGEPRQLSIHRTGTCPRFEADEETFYLLDAFEEFFF